MIALQEVAGQVVTQYESVLEEWKVMKIERSVTRIKKER